MAISTGKPKNNAQAQAQGNATGRSSVLPAFGLQTPVASLGNGGDFFERLFEALSKKIKEASANQKDSTFSVVKLLKEPNQLNYSGIIIAETMNGQTSGHVLMIEKTGEYPTQLSETIDGHRYDLTRTPADALDETYITRATVVLAEALGVDASTVTIVDGTLVPSEFDLNSEFQIDALRSNAVKAVFAENNIRVRDYKGINVADFIGGNTTGKFFISTSFNGDRVQHFDQVGMPVRQDVCVVLTFKNNTNTRNRSVNQGTDTVELVRTYGYIDFEWTGPQAGIGGFPTSQRFVPNFIITHIDSDFAPTPDIIALGVASVTTLREDMNWLQAFRSNPAVKGEVDYNDIGALNIEGNIENNVTGFGNLYDTKAKTFTLGELNTFVQTLSRQDMMVSIDVPKAGPETWYTSVFSYIQQGNLNAYARVAESVSNLTNGAFNDNGVPMFNDSVNKIHGGYFRSKGGFEDLRVLSSYLSVANHVHATSQPQALINQYTNTLYNRQIPSEIRASQRKKTIDEMSKNTAVYKQTYDRLMFNAKWLQSLVTGLRAAGFNPLPVNMGNSNEMFARRAGVDLSNALLDNSVRLMSQGNSFDTWQGMNSWYRNF